MGSFRGLSMRAKLAVLMLYLRINIKIVFGRKVLWFLIGAVIYETILYIVAMNSDNAIPAAEGLMLSVWAPTIIMTVLFSMDIISKERDANMIETLFTVSVSVYRLWLIKFTTLMVCMTIFASILILIANAFLLDLPFFTTLVSVLPPVLFFSTFTMYLSVLLKSATIAGMVVTAILAFCALTFDGASQAVVYPFLNPFDKPIETENFIWIRSLIYNKIGYTLLGSVGLWRAMKWLDSRERLLG